MQRLASVIRLVVLLTLFSAIGCAGPQLAKNNWMFPWKKSVEDSTSLADADKTSEKDDNPLRKKEDETASEGESEIQQTALTEDADAEKSDTEPAADVAKNSADASTATAGKNRVAHDQETLAYIETELKDATPDEAAILFEQLKGLEPNMVRMILKTRRLTKEYGHHSSQQMVQQVSAPDPNQNLAQNAPQNRNQFAVGHTSPQQQSAYAADNNMSPSTTQTIGGQTPWGNGGTNSYTTAAKPSYNSGTGNGFGPDGGYPDSVQQRGFAQQTRGDFAAIPANSNTYGQDFDDKYGSDFSDNSQAPGFGQQQPTGAGNSYDPQLNAQSQLAFNQTNGGTNGYDNRQQIYQQTAAQGPTLQMSQPVYAGGGMNLPEVAIHPNGGGAAPQMSSQFGDGVQRQKTPADLKWEHDLQQLISLMENRIDNMSSTEMEPAERQLFVEQQVHLRLLYLMAGRPERAFEPVRDVDPAEQEFWSHLFWGMANYFDQSGMPASADRASQTVAQLQDAVRRLQEKANLRMRNVNFCRKIDNFGNYTRFERDEFSPTQVVLVYAEFDNIRSELTAEGMYRTVLQSRIELLTPDGRLIQEPMDFPPTQDLCRNPRKDYFLNYRFSIPEGIPLGPYVMKLTVNDQLSQKVSTETLNFTVR